MAHIILSKDRGLANHGWLKSYHTFSFASYHNPEMLNFRGLRVINEDWVAPSEGFGTHPHSNMEIITYVISGALSHKDSMGNVRSLLKGQVQTMSAGTGVTHSEFNGSADEEVHLYQMWILPKENNITPPATMNGTLRRILRMAGCILLPHPTAKTAAPRSTVMLSCILAT